MKNKKMIMLACITALCSLIFFGCGITNNEVPAGYIEKEEYFQEDGFQDYADYCKYTYESIDIIVDDTGYEKVKADHVDNLKLYFENFESWMKASGRIDEYDFNKGCINEGDYVRVIVDETNDKFDNYTLYFFDVDTLTLYYIHNNI